jgi:hypothetical protein
MTSTRILNSHVHVLKCDIGPSPLHARSIDGGWTLPGARDGLRWFRKVPPSVRMLFESDEGSGAAAASLLHSIVAHQHDASCSPSTTGAGGA